MITSHVKKARSSHSRKDILRSDDQTKTIKSQPQTSKNNTTKHMNFLSANQRQPNEDKTNMKRKLIQILGGKNQPKYDLSEVQIGSKVYKVSPKNSALHQKGFKNGYCISVGNLIVQSKSNNTIKSTTQYLGNNSIQAPRKNLTDYKPLFKQIKAPLSNKNNKKQDIFSLIKVINQFVSQPTKQQSNELRYINSYVEKNSLDINKQFTTFVESFENLESPPQKIQQARPEVQSERNSLLNIFKKLSRNDKQDQDERLPLAYKRCRPPILDQFSSLTKKSNQASFVDTRPQNEEDLNFLSQKDSVTQDPPVINQQKAFSSSSSAPQFNVLSYLNPNSSSTNIQQQNLSSMQYSNNLQKRPDHLNKVLDRMKEILFKTKQNEQNLMAERDSLKQQVTFWKSKYLERQ